MAENSGWRRYNIFISSTFKDMDFERDIIKFNVIPALNRRFRPHCIELQAIDLRLGVNTSKMSEADSERKVLSVCTSCIDSARPFFIGLLGARYGWIPPEERWREFIAKLPEGEREMLRDTLGCSVTEMEIVYGALNQESFDNSHVLFYTRDADSYKNLPQEMLPAYCDADPASQEKLSRLKARVEELFSSRAGADDRCTSYHIDWNPQKGSFEGSDFEQTVTRQLAEQIEQEVQKEENEALPWWKEEKARHEAALLRKLQGAIDRDKAFDKTNEPDTVVPHYPGWGATTLMAQRYQVYNDGEDICLLVLFGLTEKSTSMRPVLARWIAEMEEILDKEVADDPDVIIEKWNDARIYDRFKALAAEASERDIEVYVFMDDIATLETTSPKDLYMGWICDDVSIFGNCEPGEALNKFAENNPQIGGAELTLIRTKKEAQAFIEAYEKEYYLELPEEIRKDIVEEATQREGILPAKLRAAFRIFESLTVSDFAVIRASGGNQIDAINNYLTDIWQGIPDTEEDLAHYVAGRVAANLGLGTGWSNVMELIFCARGGLRQDDIKALMGFTDGVQWSETDFYRYADFLSDFIYEDTQTHLWKSAYRMISDRSSADEDELELENAMYGVLASYCGSLPEGDWLREHFGLYYLLKHGDSSIYANMRPSEDYVTRTLDWYRANIGPQMRLLMQECVITDGRLEAFLQGLENDARIELVYTLVCGISESTHTDHEVRVKMASLVKDIDPSGLHYMDAFALGTIFMNVQFAVSAENPSDRSEEITYRELALAAVKASRENYGGNYNRADLVIFTIAGSLLSLYTQAGLKDKAAALEKELPALKARMEEACKKMGEAPADDPEAAEKNAFAEGQTRIMAHMGVAAKAKQMLASGDTEGAAAAVNDSLSAIRAILDDYTLGNYTYRLWLFYIQFACTGSGILGTCGRHRESVETICDALRLAQQTFYHNRGLEMTPVLEALAGVFIFLNTAVQKLAVSGESEREKCMPVVFGAAYGYLEAYLRIKELDPENAYVKMDAAQGYSNTFLTVYGIDPDDDETPHDIESITAQLLKMCSEL